MTITVLVVDDNALLRAGLVTVLGSDPEITVTGEASSGPEAVRRARDADVVLMDVEMPGGDGITATRAIVRLGLPAKVLVLTMFDLDEYVTEALRAGASGYLLKTAGPAELVAAVKTCAAGETTVAASVMARLVQTYVDRPGASAPAELETLTPRELDVLRVMAGGASNAEIGARLYLAETTVKTHVARILAKLGVRDRLQAVVVAHRAGLGGA